MSSSSALADAAEYSRTRLLRWRIVALWALQVAAVAAAAPGAPMARLMAQAGFLALGTVVLRLWDDLADLPHDRAAHPERVLSASAHPRTFTAILAAGLLLLALPVLADVRRLAIYALLVALLAALYHGPQPVRVPRTVRAGLVLVKYPVLVYLAGATPSRRAWLAALLLYAVLAVHEWRDEPELRAGPLGQVMLGGALGAAIASALFLAGGVRP